MKTYRITFSKKDALIFVSHLDFSHSIVRALKRAELPIKYSEGFSPHPKIVFGLPLSVGMSGENELLDVTLKSDDISNQQFKQRFSAALPRGIEIKSVSEPDKKLGKIKSAVYTIVFPDACGFYDKVSNVLKDTLPSVIKKTKSQKQVELDINPMIYSINARTSDDALIIEAELASSGESYLNPELVLQSISSKIGALPEHYDITREKIIFDE